LRALRGDVESLRGEVERLSNLVASIRAEYEFERNRPNMAATNVLRQPAARAYEGASDRVEKAASHRPRTATNRAHLEREWDRTERAVADLLFALSKQARFESERLRARRVITNRLRLARRLVQAERERMAIRQLRARTWWRWAFW
jgi:hypothetical protein